MPRKKAARKRIILPDPLYKDVIVAKFINVVMQRGKKPVAEKIVYGALEKIAEKNNLGKVAKGETLSEQLRKKILELFYRALDIVKPTVEVRSRRVGGATYQIPVEVKQDRGLALAMRWFVDFAVTRKEKSMAQRLGAEILDALDGKGSAIKKREDVHKMAKANQAFAHYRW